MVKHVFQLIKEERKLTKHVVLINVNLINVKNLTDKINQFLKQGYIIKIYDQSSYRILDLGNLLNKQIYIYIKPYVKPKILVHLKNVDYSYEYHLNSNLLKSLEIPSIKLNSYDFISLFKSLVKLSLPHNKLNSIPNSVFKLKLLKILVLDNNSITEISDKISRLVNLTELYLWNNKINYICEEIGQLKNLECLSLSNNKIKYLPDTLNKLSNLSKLIVTNNLLGKLDLEKNQNPRYIDVSIYHNGK